MLIVLLSATVAVIHAHQHRMHPPVKTATRLLSRHVIFAEVAELKAIAQGLSAIAPAKALWKLSDSDRVALGNASISVGRNVKIVKWVNQNDVLGHPQVKAFFTQGGTNSFHEVGSLLGAQSMSVQYFCAIHHACWLNCTSFAADVAGSNTTGQPSHFCP